MSVIVNTDYESVLFHQKPSLKMIRELEFLGLWLNDRVVTSQSYSESYLSHIEKYTKRLPKLISKDPKAQNWWGKLTDLELERELNSKKTSLELSCQIGENYGVILENNEDLKLLDSSKNYLFKSYSGVSGKGHKFLSQLKSEDFPLIAEVFHERKADFSTYCFDSGEKIFYLNFISSQFGYKGSLFDLENASSLLKLDFVKKNSELNWEKYLSNVDLIYQFVRQKGDGGFSIDSYLFDESIRTLCEINYRRTMGVTAFEIAKLISNERFQLFTIFKSNLDFSKIYSEAKSNGSVLLSHEKNYFSYLLISASNLSDLQEKVNKLESVFGTSFAIKIE